MAFDGTGYYFLPSGNPVVTNTVISETVFNLTMTDLATALTVSMNRDGQTKTTGDIWFWAEKLLFDSAADNSWFIADTDDRIDIHVGGNDTYRIASTHVAPASGYPILDGAEQSESIVAGVWTASHSFGNTVDVESGTTDDLDTISGGSEGDMVLFRPTSSTNTIVAKNGTGNLVLAGDFTMDNTEDTLWLIHDGTNWVELSRSSNGA